MEMNVRYLIKERVREKRFLRFFQRHFAICLVMDWTANENAKWLLENVCAEYRSGFEQLRSDIFDLARANHDLFGPVDHFEQEISIIDSNLHQLIVQYGFFDGHQTKTTDETLGGGLATSVQLPECSNFFDLDLAVDDHHRPPPQPTTRTDDPENNNFIELFCQLADDSRQPTTSTSTDDIDDGVAAAAESIFGANIQQPIKTPRESSEQTKNGNSGNKKKKKISGENGSSNRRTWYKCGLDGCSFGSFYSGVVKRHGHQLHGGNIKIDKSIMENTGETTAPVHHRFKCHWPGCDVSLVAFHKLVEHNRKHTGEKPFRCKWKSCNYATARLYSIIIHERTHKLDSSFYLISCVL